jgi:hypothetical protein
MLWALTATLTLGVGQASAIRFYQTKITEAPGGAPYPGSFTYAESVTADASNNVWIGDTGKGILDEYDSAQGFLRQAAGVGGWSPEGSQLEDMAVNTTSGSLYVADVRHHKVWTLNSTGVVTGSLADPESRWNTSRLHVSVDNTGGAGSGQIYVAAGGYNNPGVYRVNPNGSPADFTASHEYIEGNRLTGTPEGSFGEVMGAAVGPNGNLYVIDRAAAYVFDSTGTFLYKFSDVINEGAPDTMRNLRDIAVDPLDGHIIIAGEAYPAAVWEFEEDGSFLEGITGGGPFISPKSVAVDSNGRLYVADTCESPSQVCESSVRVFSQDYPSPKIAYGAPTEEVQTGGTVHATIDPNNGGPVTSCEIQYGTDTSYGSSVPCSPDPASSPPGSNFTQITGVSGILSVLSPEETYHYRVVAGNVNASRYGSDQIYIPHWVMGLDTTTASEVAPTGATLNGSFTGNGAHTTFHFEWGKDSSYGSSTPEQDAGSPSGPATVATALGGLAPVSTYHYRVVATNSDGESKGDDEVFTTPPLAPVVSEWVTDVHSDSALLHAKVNPGGGPTTYHFEYVNNAEYQEGGFANASDIPSPDSDAGSSFADEDVESKVAPLSPGTTYHYRVVAANSYATVSGEARTFTTFAYGGHESDPCANSQVRQQTGAALLMDCRAFELVSAADTAGYDVESDIVPGQKPFGGYPLAMGPSKVLYAMHQGAVPGNWNPTNLGPDPYVATRGEAGWSTQYVGLPADGMPSAHPFASAFGGADAQLGTVAFAGNHICAPCFADGKTGVPVRLPDGSIVQGMAGSLDPGSGANADILVRKRLSDDGSHLVFGSTSKFEPDGNSEGDPSIYDRDLQTRTTHVVSKLPNGENIPCLSSCSSKGVAELDISNDGSRVLVGQLISTDAEGNNYWHLYMNVGDSPQSIDLMPGSTSGGLYDGMDAKGMHVYFSTPDKLSSDTDTSADIYRADVGSSSASVSRVSIGSGGAGDTDACDPALNNTRVRWNSTEKEANCNAVAIGGGGGVSRESGDIYFLSPELLDGANGTQDAPNLYLARVGSPPHYVTTLESSMAVPQPPPAGHPFIRSFGSLHSPSGIGFDPARDYVYVLEPEFFSGKVERFDSKGHPVKFTAGSEAGDNVLTGADGGGFLEYEPAGLANQIAVDQTSGDFFVPSVFDSAIKRFSATGEFLSSLSVPFASAVAVNQGNGAIYAASFFGTVAVFDSTGTPITEFPTIESAKSVAVDSNGNVYVANGSEAAMFDASGAFVRNLEVETAQGVAVDRSDDHVYVDEGGQIAEFDASGARVGTPAGSGILSESTSVAVDSGTLVAPDAESGKISVWGPTAILFDKIYDNPAVLDAVGEADTRRTGDFQVSSSGDFAAFTSKLSLTGYDNDKHVEIYRYDAGSDAIDCASCPSTGARTTGDANLAPQGQSLAEDGRVFFDSTDPLIPSDLNGAEDVFEWEEGRIGPISSGTSPIDSSLLSISAGGADAYFFTRQTLAPQDENGNSVKVYDARAGGGFPFDPTRPPCKASDECHGPGTVAAPPPDIGTYQGTRGNSVKPQKKHRRRHRRPHRRHRHKNNRHHRQHKGRRND